MSSNYILIEYFTVTPNTSVNDLQERHMSHVGNIYKEELGTTRYINQIRNNKQNKISLFTFAFTFWFSTLKSHTKT